MVRGWEVEEAAVYALGALCAVVVEGVDGRHGGGGCIFRMRFEG